jgi:putative colanic acid biosynthesis UDP-glucose lipid carrier transferase
VPLPDIHDAHLSNLRTIKGSVKDIFDYAINNNIKEIYSTLLPDDNKNVQELMTMADKHFLRIKFVPDFTNMLRSTYHINYLSQFPVISLRDEPLEDTRNQLFKRAFDILFSVFALVFVVSWLYPILAILIKLSSRGPVIFKQLRSGQDNKPFWCYKFRTMQVNTQSDSAQASKNDARVTWIGNIMRKTSLDELPQFFNVLTGDMSVVGPRPHMLMHTEQYSAIISKFMVRHFVKPGITGWAQINGLRGGTETNDLMEKRVEHDIWYMEHWSIWLDVKVIFRTVFNVFKGEEHAY